MPDRHEQVQPISALLNRHCLCSSLDSGMLRQAMALALGSADLAAMVEERCPYLFSAQPLFISDHQAQRMADVVRAIESVVALPAYRERVLAGAPAIARHDPGGARSVFFGYDFHVTDIGVGLIEININAGGAMFNAVMSRAHQACCTDRTQLAAAAAGDVLEKHIIDMFQT